MSRNIAQKKESIDGRQELVFPHRNAQTFGEDVSLLKHKQWEDMETFYQLVQETKNQTDEMVICMRKVRELHNKILNEPGVHQKYTDELNRNVEKFVSLSRMVSDTTKRIKDENDSKHLKISFANLRIRKNNEMTLRRRLLQVTGDFHAEQIEYKEKCRDRINSYLTISGLHMPEEEVDQAIESGKLFNTVVIMMAEREKKLLFEDVKSRHEDIVRLEKSIRELHDMFQDLTMLVENQGEMVNHIETNVDQATEHAENALRSVKVAEENKKRNIKLRIALAICIVISIVLIFFMGTTVFCVYFPFICR